MLIGATMCALLLVLLPLIVAYRWTFLGQRLPAAGCAASVVALAGYMPAILAHYRIGIGHTQHGPTRNPEPAERRLVVASTVLAVAFFGASLFATSAG